VPVAYGEAVAQKAEDVIAEADELIIVNLSHSLGRLSTYLGKALVHREA
jgi:hypothetical protein